MAKLMKPLNLVLLGLFVVTLWAAMSPTFNPVDDARGFVSGLFGKGSTANIQTTITPGVVSSQKIERCEFGSAITNATAAFTARADPASVNRVYIDVDTNIWDYSNNNTAQGEINASFTCYRAGSTQEAENYLIVLKGDEFRNETGGTEANIYNILESGTSPSSTWAGAYQKTIYAKSGNYATSSDSREFVYLSFAAGAQSATLSVWGEVSETGFGALNNYSAKTVHISQRDKDSKADSELAQVVVLRVP